MKTKEDFLTNPDFVRWVRHPDAQLDAYWEKWIKANPEYLEELKKAKHFLLMVKYKEIQPPEGLKQEILHQLLRDDSPMNKARTPEVPPISSIRAKTTWEKISQFYRIAAILLLSFSLGWLLIPAPQNVPESLATAVPILIHKSTTSGEKLQITLPDGTRVWLNSVSEISYPEKFDPSERKVFLNGEAFFDVENDSLRPFIVVSDELVTTAIGTSFNINNKGRNSINVALVTGKVQVKSSENEKKVILIPGQKLTYLPATKEQTIKPYDPDEVIAWMDGLLIFREANLKEVVMKLEEWFGVKVNLRNPEGVNWKFSGEYHNQTLEDILKSMSFIQGFKYEINNKNVELEF